MIHLRAYRAIEEEASCMEFARSHRKVLEGFNLGNISTNNYDWAYNPNVYVVEAVDPASNELLGGIRVQVADGVHDLPVEEAVYHFDPNISEMVKHYALNGGTGELCGLWNSRTKAPNTGITMNLVVAGVAICNQLPITSLFTIVGSYTLKMALRLGYRVETTLGDNGEFSYPKSNYIARVLSMDPQTLEHTYAVIKERIYDLRENPGSERMEVINATNQILYTHDLSLAKVAKTAYALR